MPVMGRIAAGTPIEAIQTRSHTISMPPDLLTSGEHFALEVRGDSMIEAGILDGDMVLLKRTDAADTGDIVVALIDDEEATLKRFRRRGASIALEPANTAYEVAYPAAEPGAHSGQAGRAVPPLLSGTSNSGRRGQATKVTRPSASVAAFSFTAVKAEEADLLGHRRRLDFKRLCGCGAFLDQRRVLLIGFVDLRQRAR